MNSSSSSFLLVVVVVVVGGGGGVRLKGGEGAVLFGVLLPPLMLILLVDNINFMLDSCLITPSSSFFSLTALKSLLVSCLASFLPLGGTRSPLWLRKSTPCSTTSCLSVLFTLVALDIFSPCGSFGLLLGGTISPLWVLTREFLGLTSSYSCPRTDPL